MRGAREDRARPGGHATGFADAPASITGKWLDLLKEMAPRINRVAVMYGTGTAPGDGLYYLQSIKAEAYSKHLKAIGIRVKNAGEIKQDIRGLAREPDGALIVTPDLTTTLFVPPRRLRRRKGSAGATRPQAATCRHALPEMPHSSKAAASAG
jgi:ABC-type uncharacterized transport system substrate-binding protein